ncbi:MAG: efflux RND transporter periplasmic adaptor subunit [Methylococcales bacterium]|nr:efflux RND transporter periplasmic adaptor subunit [Methylococcales bacterium]
MKTPYKIALMLLTACLLLAMGGGMGWRLAVRQAGQGGAHFADHAEAATAEQPRKVLYWYDPMMPQQHFDKPGKSPFMDMQLIAKYADDQTENASREPSGIRIDPEAAQNIAIRLAAVSRIPLRREIEVSGQVAFNDRDVAIVQTRSGGFVERVWPLAVGDTVKAGQPLAEILVPGWAAAQQELLAVRGMADAELLTAARERLRLLGMPENLIRRLESSGAAQVRHTVTAPIAGVIQDLEVRNGMTLAGGQTLARINGLSSVWLDVAVPEAQADVAQVGGRAEVMLGAYPARRIQGRVAAVLPALNQVSRSIRARIELKNPERWLRPGLSAQVRLSSPAGGTALVAPTEALIRTGKRTLVMLAGENGRYTPQEVVIGHEIGDRTVIVAGLEEGRQVVASGQFLIDSEASLEGIQARPAAGGMDGAP